MLRFKIKEAIAKKEFDENRLVKVAEICDATGIGRTTLSAMINNKKKNVGIDNFDKLCVYFDCELHELVEFVKDN
jgi:putative transcriptional regulator